jgi:hypothetical protein
MEIYDKSIKQNNIKGNKYLRLIISLFLIFVLIPPSRADAAPGTGTPPSSITGTFYLSGVSSNAVTHWGSVSVNGGYDVVSFSGSFSCTSSSQYNTWDGTGSYNPGPTTNWGTFRANLDRIDEQAGIAYYYAGWESVFPNGRSHDGYMQNLGYGTIAIAWSFVKGTINLEKSSAAPEITNGNPCYSLEGAVYGVYSSYSAAQSNGSRVGTITTNAQGQGSIGNLELGTYYVKEITAPPGYFLDPTIYTAATSSGSPVKTVYSSDLPNGDPFLILLQKIDSETGGTYGAGELPQGSASLADAEYTVKYYTEFFTSVQGAQAASPTRIWVVGTNANGFARLDDSNLVGGDPLYHDPINGYTIILFGTITVEETKAPVGYLLPRPGDSNYKVYLTRYVPDPTQPGGVRIEGDGNGVQQGNEPKQTEKVMRGDLELTKYIYLHEPDSVVETGVTEPEPNAVFDFYASRDFAGTEPYDWAQPAFSLTTDADGYASTVSSDIYLIQNPDGSYTVTSRPADASGGLPYDSYLSVQRTTDPAYEKCPNFVYVIGADGIVVSHEAFDHVIPAYISVVKLDAETGLKIAYPATWQIWSEQTKSYVSMYDGAKMTDTFTSDSQGNLVLPEQLPYGDYLLHEVDAPADSTTGYLLNPVDIPFSVTERHEIDNPLVVTMEDTPAKGTISIIKTDNDSEEPCDGAEYTITADGDIVTLDGTVRAADGDVVETIVTDRDGKATSSPLYLGNYIVEETVAPEGYRLDPNDYKVAVLYKDQETPIVAKKLELTDVPFKHELEKRDIDTDAPIGDTEFTLYKETAAGTDIWDEVGIYTTDEDGKIKLAPIAVGSYKIIETRPNPKYEIISEEESTRYFTIEEGSTDEIQVIYNKAIQISVAVYKHTIALTSSAFDGEDMESVDNVGKEEYLYHFGAKSTSNVWADEFVVTDSSLDATLKGYRMTTLWTGTSPEGLDFDGKVTLLYKTNMTGAGEQPCFGYDFMAANPENPNNPKRETLYSEEPGWRIWQEGLSTSVQQRLDVSALGLAEGEYITGLKLVYGGVDVDFFTGSEYAVTPEGPGFGVMALSNYEDWSYAVVATSPLQKFNQTGLETVIFGDVDADIMRNVVLTDVDVDEVMTRVIAPFMIASGSNGMPPNPEIFPPDNGGLPGTGDNHWLFEILIGFLLAGLTMMAVSSAFRRRSLGY